MRMLTRMVLCGAVGLLLVGCGSSSKSSTGTVGTSTTAPSGSTAAPGSTAPSGSTTTATETPGSTGTSATTTADGGDPKPTGEFCTDIRDGAVANALGDAANPNPAANSLDALKRLDSEAPSEIKSQLDAMVSTLTDIRNAGTDSAKAAALAANGPKLQTAATTIANYITAHCVG